MNRATRFPRADCWPRRAFLGRRSTPVVAAIRSAESSTVVPAGPTRRTSTDHALEALTSEFQEIPVRIVLSIFQSYLAQLREVAAAADATRERILDACLVA